MWTWIEMIWQIQADYVQQLHEGVCGRGEINNSAILDNNSTDRAVIYVKCGP